MDEGASTLPSAPAAPQARQGGREAILVVEDDAAVRAVAVATLESVGYRVQQAADGRLALEILRQAGEIDLLFTDLVMPNGISGQDLLRMARELRPDLKAIFTSGYSEQFIRGREEADKDVPLLPKPYRRQKLTDIVRSVLDRTALRRASRRLTCPWRRGRWRRCRCAIPRPAPAPS